MKARHKRFGFLLIGMAGLALVSWLIFNALGSNISYFFSPSDIAANKAPPGHLIRLGGLVKEGSLERGKELTIRFVVTDKTHDVDVAYTGILPDLFAEGQGVVAQGRMGRGGVFVAEQVLAKHDENYMAPEVAEALDEAKLQELSKSAVMEAKE
jgi:cytochrome c-type biogenesis protein CcmE